MDNRRKILFIALAVFIVVSVGAVIFTAAWKASHNATLYLLYAPSTATATLDGKLIKSGNSDLKPGKYTLTVEKDGFETSTQTVELVGGVTKSALVCLVSNSDSTKDWYSNNDDDTKTCDQAAAKDVQTQGDYVEDHFPISRKLPVTGFDYKIDYSLSPTRGDKEYAILITYYDVEGKQNALDAIKFLGYDPATFEIIYTDESNS